MNRTLLIAGDLLALAAVTVIGFASHGELSAAFLPRMAASFVPLVAAWFVLAPWLGLFEEQKAGRAGELWRPSLVLLFAGPLAALLRGIALNTPLMPAFVVVLTLTAAVGLSLWRLAWVLLQRHRQGG